MTRFSLTLVAKLFAAILIIIVIRALGELFRIEYVRPDPPLTYPEARPFIAGALAAAVSLLVTLLAIGLFIYRVYFIPA